MFDRYGPAVVVRLDIAPFWLELGAEIPHQLGLGILVEGSDSTLTVCQHVFIRPSV